MSAAITTPVRRRLRRWHVVLLVLLCVVIPALLWGQWRTIRTQRLVAEIVASGGRVQLGTSAPRLLWERFQGWSGEDPTCVRLGAGTTQEWLRSWDDLADLSINELRIDEAAELGPELGPLVARHPLEEFIATGATGADEIAIALSANRTLRYVHVRDSDLTDAGLRQFPLEQLYTLNIAGTRVTVDGLRELRRLPEMSKIILDGRQVTAETITQLEQSPHRYRLWLYGPDVTEDTLQTLKIALASSHTHKLMCVYIGNSSVSRSAVQAWTQDVPTVEIMYTAQADPDRFRMRSRGFTPRFWTRWFGR